MTNILLVSGSPASQSRTGVLLDLAAAVLEAEGLAVTRTSILEYPADDLIQARFSSQAFEPFKAQVAEARGLIVSSPVYKASFSGGLKTLLDILPPDALKGKTILPIVSAGTLAHLLSIEYALKPILSVLGARHIEQGVFAVDDQFIKIDKGYEPSDALRLRLEESLKDLMLHISR